MKKFWLRGVLFGVSIALLLSGGVALALPMLDIEASTNCFVCSTKGALLDEVDLDIEGYGLALEEEDVTSAISMGFQFALFMDGGPPAFDRGYDPDRPECTISLWVPCSEEMMFVDLNDEDCRGRLKEESPPSVANLKAEYGEWTAEVCEESNGAPEAAADVCDEVQFRFAEVCEEEFVPEPGTIALLGSGLVGLAGYATLRWRTRE